MNDYMNDLKEPQSPPQSAEPPESQNSYYNQNPNGYNQTSNSYGQTSNGYGQPVNSYNGYNQNQNNGYNASPSDNVYSSADVYELGRNFNNYGVSTDSMLIATLKAILGAVVGAIPGLLAWILIGKVGVVAALCGALLAFGVISGYTFMTKDNYPHKYGLIICLAVIVIGIFFADRIVWCWELSEEFQKVIKETRASIYSLGDENGLSKAEVDAIFNPMIEKEYGFIEGTFSDFFFNFGRTLKNFDLTLKYVLDLLLSYFIALLGGTSLLAKFSKR